MTVYPDIESLASIMKKNRAFKKWFPLLIIQKLLIVYKKTMDSLQKYVNNGPPQLHIEEFIRWPPRNR